VRCLAPVLRLSVPSLSERLVTLARFENSSANALHQLHIFELVSFAYSNR
jgi:hypothetical protein